MITKSPYGLGIMVVFLVVAIAVAALSIDTTLSAYAQNTTTSTPTPTSQPLQNQTADPQQIKNYLTQAIQALDSGDNTKALEQVDLAEDQLESVTGTEGAEDEDEDEEVEEGPGEDKDEPGDIDTNDEEDTP
ncbi:MAG TPA: hypothetical protein VKA91_10475 [Nitrososphaeraceae archaeon]|nr:hypothetical protein [Nitrososphaeraceae archaeon]